MTKKRLNAKAVLKSLIKIVGETDTWKGNCFALASQAVKHGLVEGDAVYGMWHGPVAPGSFFEVRGQAIPFTNHGWINLPDGQVCDPTRWVFENVEPYIYVGPADHYDEGANELRRHQPPPDFDAFDLAEKTVTFREYHLGSEAWTFTEKLLRLDRYLSAGDEAYEPGTITIEMLFWVANRPPDVLGKHAAEIYEAIQKVGYGAAIPFDNKKMVERLAKAGAAPSASALNPRTGQPRQPSRASR